MRIESVGWKRRQEDGYPLLGTPSSFHESTNHSSCWKRDDDWGGAWRMRNRVFPWSFCFDSRGLVVGSFRKKSENDETRGLPLVGEVQTKDQSVAGVRARNAIESARACRSHGIAHFLNVNPTGSRRDSTHNAIIDRLAYNTISPSTITPRRSRSKCLQHENERVAQKISRPCLFVAAHVTGLHYSSLFVCPDSKTTYRVSLIPYPP